jgi:glycosyltransferase involved in cell wall biosynthesis
VEVDKVLFDADASGADAENQRWALSKSAWNRKPRLALVHYTAPPIVGGVERVLGDQARLLVDAGYDVRVVAGRGDAVLVPEADSRHPEADSLLRGLKEGRAVEGLFDSLRYRIREKLLSVLADRDVVIVHNILTMPLNLAFASALVDLSIPLIAWTHDLEPDQIVHASLPACEIPRTPQPGVTYVAISEVRRQQLVSRLGLEAADIALVPNGIDPFRFAGLGPQARRLLSAADALDADPLILVPQRITRNKRLELTLEAAAHLVPHMPGLRVLVTGPVDPHCPKSRAYAADLLRRRSVLGLDDSVRFLFEQSEAQGRHPLHDEDLAELYRISDAVLLTSGGEGFGLPLLEAGLARVPIVCTDLPVFREVSGGRIHAFQAAAQGDAVASAVERALASEFVQHRREVLRRYSWSALLTKYEQVLQRAVARGREQRQPAPLVTAPNSSAPK